MQGRRPQCQQISVADKRCKKKCTRRTSKGKRERGKRRPMEEGFQRSVEGDGKRGRTRKPILKKKKRGEEMRVKCAARHQPKGTNNQRGAVMTFSKTKLKSKAGRKSRNHAIGTQGAHMAQTGVIKLTENKSTRLAGKELLRGD